MKGTRLKVGDVFALAFPNDNPPRGQKRPKGPAYRKVKRNRFERLVRRKEDDKLVFVPVSHATVEGIHLEKKLQNEEVALIDIWDF